jgi:hypothetical protein
MRIKGSRAKGNKSTNKTNNRKTRVDKSTNKTNNGKTVCRRNLSRSCSSDVYKDTIESKAPYNKARAWVDGIKGFSTILFRLAYFVDKLIVAVDRLKELLL